MDECSTFPSGDVHSSHVALETQYPLSPVAQDVWREPLDGIHCRSEGIRPHLHCITGSVAAGS